MIGHQWGAGCDLATSRLPRDGHHSPHTTPPYMYGVHFNTYLHVHVMYVQVMCRYVTVCSCANTCSVEFCSIIIPCVRRARLFRCKTIEPEDSISLVSAGVDSVQPEDSRPSKNQDAWSTVRSTYVCTEYGCGGMDGVRSAEKHRSTSAKRASGSSARLSMEG